MTVYAERVNHSKPERGYLAEREAIREVMQKAAWAFGVEVIELTFPCREREIVRYRYIAMAAARLATGASFPALAAAFKRDHSTVIHGVAKVEKDPLLHRFLSDFYPHLAVESGVDIGGRGDVQPPPGPARTTEVRAHE